MLDDKMASAASEFILFGGIIWLSVGVYSLSNQEHDLSVFVLLGWFCILIGIFLSLKAQKEEDNLSR
ncbi:hypothetical protein [Thermococcus sp.]|uniref:hypothetical protein n=1 Tax=Thermococcus sp. TaxID=35749 RepID=UPI00260F91F9|nr:hypothetical protein [Thermococcus sp.]MCD6143404.1 hypothetical protein [Thermococcus sp.]